MSTRSAIGELVSPETPKYDVNQAVHSVRSVNKSSTTETSLLKRTNEYAGSHNITTKKNRSFMDNILDHVNIYCRKHEYLRHLYGQGHAYLFRKTTLAYCSVPKTGCTFWKRVIRFLNEDGPNKLESPFDIPRYHTHFLPFLTTPIYSLTEGNNILGNYSKFMFTRDPYSRLWSGFLDKLFLPDFWDFGKHIIRTTRKNAKSLSLACGHDVTFQEFISYIVDNPDVDPHFAPVYIICNPCSTNFSVIGKQETFVLDAYYILENAGLSSILNQDLFTHSVENEIKTLTEDHVNIVKLISYSKCVDALFVYERLWKVFQLNGYISFNVQMPLHLSSIRRPDALKQEFISQAVNAHHDGMRYGKLSKNQKYQSLVRAYRRLPLDLLKAVQETFRIDFELFDYSKQPDGFYE